MYNYSSTVQLSKREITPAMCCVAFPSRKMNTSYTRASPRCLVSVASKKMASLSSVNTSVDCNFSSPRCTFHCLLLPVPQFVSDYRSSIDTPLAVAPFFSRRIFYFVEPISITLYPMPINLAWQDVEQGTKMNKS
jgi:hypothetical protein